MRTRGVSGRTLQPLFWMTSSSYTVSDLEENFRRLTPNARDMLANIGHAKWARAYFPNIRWNVVNIDVSHFFVLSVNQRNVLIIMLTETIRGYIQRSFDECRLMADKIPASLTTVLTSYAEVVLHKRMQKSVRWQATKTPSPLCPKFINLGITCGHAIAASRHSNIHELLDMFWIYYWADVFQTAYQTQTVHPLPPPSEWKY
uniref:Uncharacterized protein n=1 Tax=Lactuca sativa TaxID=4236 RepID=A0A9R1XF09_LACSA|nr:hypothetical protein LSAT_V11C500271170 [Lactuca sativa]